MDPEDEVAMIDRRAGDGVVRVAILENERGGTLTTQLLPGFSLPLAGVFAP